MADLISANSSASSRPSQLVTPPAHQIFVMRGLLQVEPLLVLLVQPGQHAVEDVVIPLVLNMLLIICFGGGREHRNRKYWK